MVALTLADVCNASALVQALHRDLAGLVETRAGEDVFLFFDPDGVTVPESRFPFCTLVTGDRYDAASHLDRDPQTYRLNLGVSRQAYEARFGPAPRQPAGYEVIDTGHDYTSTDAVMPHPFYAPMRWVCVVNPGPASLEDVNALVDDAYALARRKYRHTASD